MIQNKYLVKTIIPQSQRYQQNMAPQNCHIKVQNIGVKTVFNTPRIQIQQNNKLPHYNEHKDPNFGRATRKSTNLIQPSSPLKFVSNQDESLDLDVLKSNKKQAIENTIPDMSPVQHLHNGTPFGEDPNLDFAENLQVLSEQHTMDNGKPRLS